MFTINTNSSASRTANLLANIQRDLDLSARRVASGKRILTAADDPAGMGVASLLKTQHRSYDAVQKNITAGMSLLDVASTSLNNQQEILKEMRALALQAASGTLSADQRAALDETFQQLKAQLDTAVNNATIFGQNLTNASAANVTLQVGINGGDTFTLTAAKSDAATLGVNALDLTSVTNATAAITAIDNAVGTVSSNQSIIGAQQNGLKQLIENSKTVQDNLETAIGRIEDVDMPAEIARMQQLQTKMQLATAMMGMISQMPSYLLQLLR